MLKICFAILEIRKFTNMKLFFFFCRVTLHSFRDVFTNTKLQLRTSRVLIVGLNIPGRLYHLPCISFGC